MGSRGTNVLLAENNFAKKLKLHPKLYGKNTPMVNKLILNLLQNTAAVQKQYNGK